MLVDVNILAAVRYMYLFHVLFATHPSFCLQVPGAEPQKYDEIEGLGKMTSVVTEYLGGSENTWATLNNPELLNFKMICHMCRVTEGRGSRMPKPSYTATLVTSHG
jgi:hypothetical protein